MTASARRGTATPIPTPIPTPVQSLCAFEWASAAAVAGVASAVVDVLEVDFSVLLSAVVITGFAFVVTDERIDDELDGVNLDELDNGEDVVEEVDEDSVLIEAVEVLEVVEEDEDVVEEVVEEVVFEVVVDIVEEAAEEAAAGDTVTAVKFQ